MTAAPPRGRPCCSPPSLREGVDLPDDCLRFQIITKVPYPDLGDPWTAVRRNTASSTVAI
jgi:Rad3-related DNA helicase